MKQVIIVRKDLKKMSCGKIAGQAAHASVRACKLASFWRYPYLWWCKRKWFKEGETKIVLKVKSEEELVDIMYKCLENNLKYAGVRDAGRTQIEAGTLTAVAIGPYPDEIIDNITEGLKLL